MSFVGLLSALTLVGVQSAPIDSSRALQIFREAEALSNRDNGKLWGKALYGPMMFVDTASGYVVANQADKEGKLKPSGGLFVGTLPPSFAAANTAKQWAGVKWTMMLWPLPELPHARGQLAMHECYHRIQEDLGLPASDDPISHLDGREGRTWLRLEMRALSEALQSTGEERWSRVRDALDFRAARGEACGQPAAEAERVLEMNEGLADYTGLMLSGFGAPSLDARAAVRLEEEQAAKGFARSFAYATGPAYGRLLDGRGVAWRKGLSREKSLSEMLRANLKHKPRTDTEHLLKIAARYDGAYLIREETMRAEKTAALLAGYQKKYVDGPILSIPIANDFNYSFNPNDVVAFPGVGQVLGTAKVTCEWGVLEVGGGVLMKRNDQGFITGIVVPAPANGALLGDGWKLTLAPGWAIMPGQRAGDFVVSRK